MAWIPLHQSVRDHRKTVLLAELLGVDEPCALGHVAFLWLWAIDNAPDGVIPSSDRVIAKAAQWDGDASEFRASLVASGFLDEENGSVSIHSWDKYAGKLLHQRELNAEKQQRYRNRQVTSRERENRVTVTLRSREEKSREEKKTERNIYPPDFEAFWKSYPSGNGAKNKTFESWKRINPDDDLRREIMDGLARWNESKRWIEGYVKAADIWLRDRLWENPPPPLSKPRKQGSILV